MGVLFSDQVEYVDSAPSEEKVKKKTRKNKGGQSYKKKYSPIKKGTGNPLCDSETCP